MDAYTAQWIGKRKQQEDAYGVRHFPAGTLAVICDGMGGHDDGALSSRSAVDAFLGHFDLGVSGRVTDALNSALAAANKAVGEIFAKRDSFGGCTLLAVFIQRGLLWWISVGDSPLFLWRGNKLKRLNEDHSMRALYADLVPSGTLTYDEAMSRGHMLRSALTGETLCLIDAPVRPLPLLPRDRIILSSDGTEELLFNPMLSLQTSQLLNKRGGNLAAEIVEACRQLDAPGADNATVVAFDC